MDNTSTKFSASQLMLAFLSSVSEFDVKFISGLNPFYIKVDGEEMCIYIKNLSPAQLSNNNPDIWRVQLPLKDDFEKVKESDIPFFLFGYDSKNKVYTTWNPYWCKQRLNVGKSVSLYSRLTLQKRVRESGKIETMELNNDWEVICLPENKLYDFLKTYKEYYPKNTPFIAKGSSIQNKLRKSIDILGRADTVQEDTLFSKIEPKAKLDSFGKLISLNEEIKSKLYPIFKADDYPDFEKMISVAESYYPSYVCNNMTASDWISLFRKTSWHRTKNQKKVTKGSYKKKEQGKSKYIRVTNPDGTIIQENSVAKTFVKTIEENSPDLISRLSLGFRLISRKRMPDFPRSKRSQQFIDAGYYISTNFNSAQMATILERISDKLNLGLKIELLQL